MGELELIGLHDDGEHLVLAAPDGQRFRLRIDEPLRAAVRRDRPQLEQLRAARAGSLSPREIQMRIRAGSTAQEVADEADLVVEQVRRYEGPVLAERAFIADQARSTRVGRDAGAPVLGDLVTDRLAARGVALVTLAWDAHRSQSGPWFVVARFMVGDGDEREARWTFDPAKRVVQADEDEARWLSETEIADEPIPRRHLAAVRDMVFDVEATGAVRPVLESVDAHADRADELEAVPEPDPRERTHALLDDLSSRRGIRQQIDLDDDTDDEEEFEGFGPQHAFDFATFEAQVPGAHPVDADPAAEATVLPAPHARPEPASVTRRLTRAGDDTAVQAADEAPVPERAKARKARAKVPSWDEIVFGAKPE
ncbi:MAG TPA: septation protein SepH [Cellulomonas sp.]|uniref:septation protein SepH n=1 Tax=Cellulomonas sp. TaxID=40001 RepID=UPI002E308D4D|nr:septation protein SepH [Cellulomonas sp.]HEX5333351.1 septation protein SepH [Cellulomonas sp.]